ncbi:30S ribosomal protein S30e [Candidatus Bathyarchaeota archaeon]|nr:MAG: 30S ribosomal protein S30e [Candidatus Bathyarchaeota archaeon]
MPTHGSLTKAGKVRAQTPKIEKSNMTKRPGPRRRNSRNYHSRIVYQPVDKQFRRRR